eukprot:5374240-Alexandrium_andersonii.AAC.1
MNFDWDVARVWRRGKGQPWGRQGASQPKLRAPTCVGTCLPNSKCAPTPTSARQCKCAPTL